jgi:rSAM/selenodomain-associated transferase 2
LARIPNRADWEVIVVDGKSTDQTARIAAQCEATVVSCTPGRGRQMNAGAAVAQGGTLLFLHADTVLPVGFSDSVAEVLDRPRTSAGAFRLKIDSDRRGFSVAERLVQYRSRFLQMPYGDQAIFLRTSMFRRVGGFPDWPNMEDFELMLRLRRLGRVRIASSAVVTSGRRWIRHGLGRTTLWNQICVIGHWLRVSPERIHRWREQFIPA